MEVLQALTKIKYTINCKLIEKLQTDQYEKYAVFDDLQDGSKQKSITFMAII